MLPLFFALQSCSDDDDGSSDNGTPPPNEEGENASIRFTIEDRTSNAQEGFIVELYRTEEDFRNRENPLRVSSATNRFGLIALEDLEPADNYFFYAYKDCISNYNFTVSTGELKAGERLQVVTATDATADIRIINVSEHPFQVRLGSEREENVLGGGTLEFNNLPTGDYTVRVRQTDGFIGNPTTNRYDLTLECGDEPTLNIPQ